MDKILCFLFGHRYFLIKKYTKTTRKIGCHRCGKEFGMNDDVQVILEWDKEFENCMKMIEKWS